MKMTTLALLFLGSAAQAEPPRLVRIDHELNIAAPREKLWWALTTPEGLRGWIAPQSKVVLEVGGAYELYFTPDNPADRGMEGTRVLAFVPGEVLSVSGEAANTWTVWRLDSVPGGTRVRFSGLGHGPEWEARVKYFDKQMPSVLRRLADSLRD
jgi:uncharacterized protein YndB with AHSA1/START domain